MVKEDAARILVNIKFTQMFLRSAHNVIRILAYEQIDSIMPLCGSDCTKVFIDPFDMELHTAIQKRRHTREYFHEKEILNCFVDIMKALGSYHFSLREHGYVCPLSVFVCGRNFKLMDGNFFPINHFIMCKLDDKSHYAAPELYNQRSVSDGDLININVYKCDVFSFGLTLLAMASLKTDFRDIYDDESLLVNKAKLENEVNSCFSEGYSELLRAII